jgi:hypothetical protein
MLVAVVVRLIPLVAQEALGVAVLVVLAVALLALLVQPTLEVAVVVVMEAQVLRRLAAQGLLFFQSQQ